MRYVIRFWDWGPPGAMVRSLVFVLIGLILTACAGPSNERIARFAQSGVSFAGQIPRVYDYAFGRAVERDSETMLRDRKRVRDLLGKNLLTKADASKALQKQYDETRAQFEKRLQSFNTMKKHASALSSYFVALNALASGASSEAAGNAAAEFARQLGGLAPEVKTVSLGDKSLTSLIGPLAQLAVAEFTNARLQAHLERYAKTVAEAIAYQRAMFELLIEIERNRKKAPGDTEIRQAFLRVEKDLPPNWVQQNLQSFSFQLQPSPISAARIAAEQLQTNFEELAKGGQGALPRLQRSVVFAETMLTIYQSSQ